MLQPHSQKNENNCGCALKAPKQQKTPRPFILVRTFRSGRLKISFLVAKIIRQLTHHLHVDDDDQLSLEFPV